MNDKKFLLKLLAVASNFVFEIMAGLVVGFLLGRFIDGLLNIEHVLSIVLMSVFALVSVRNFMVRVYRLGAKDDDRKDIS